ncbi:hypothetical protein BpHYR1_037951 [Brachionus plicatilis]|uniref:SAP domain-containing protein n=1 Tax=Brachionus plicatilis TaxID=10195 RepID=A0A3M7QDI7_BRAPC|nr:hypothetical protein BpHYR1_037951 [Brachionus plicatilis]
MDIPKYDMTLRAVDLQKLYKQFKLVYSGTKAQMIERLDNYFKSIQNNQSRESESDFESDSEFEEIQPCGETHGVDEDDHDECVLYQNNKRIRQIFIIDSHYETLEEAKTVIQEEALWKTERMRNSKSGLKHFFK